MNPEEQTPADLPDSEDAASAADTATLTDPLLDGATPQTPVLPPELASKVRLAADSGIGLPERIDAFEDIIDSEVGDTSLTRARNLERETGLRQIYLKFDGGNPTGTQKDRIAFAQAMDAMRRGFDCITVATCGNYGAAMAVAAHTAGLRCLVYIPQAFHTRRVKEMDSFGAEIVWIEGDYEAAVHASQERAARDELYDANPGGNNTPIQLRAYGEIAVEIYDELRDAPAVVAVPVSNGTTLSGIHRGFQSLWRRGKTSHMPRMVAGSSPRKNPIVQSFLRGLPRCEDLQPARIRETRVNEPLVNWHSIDGDHALSAVRETDGWADSVTDKSMLGLARRIRETEGLNVLPASTAGLAALLQRHAKQPLTSERYVVVLTGRRS